MKPSDYFDRNCFVGASNMEVIELERRYMIGVGNMLWGNDFPHPEGHLAAHAGVAQVAVPQHPDRRDPADARSQRSRGLRLRRRRACRSSPRRSAPRPPSSDRSTTRRTAPTGSRPRNAAASGWSSRGRGVGDADTGGRRDATGRQGRGRHRCCRWDRQGDLRSLRTGRDEGRRRRPRRGRARRGRRGAARRSPSTSPASPSTSRSESRSSRCETRRSTPTAPSTSCATTPASPTRRSATCGNTRTTTGDGRSRSTSSA